MAEHNKNQAARIDELEFRLKVIERQHPEFFTNYSSLIQSQQDLEHKVIEQEHRFLSIWFNFFRSFGEDHKGKRWPALKAVLQWFIPSGRVALIITSGTLIGLFTILLMFQNNKLLASQNYWLQRQINVQAESQREVQMIDIMEKLYEATPESMKEFDSYRKCSIKRNTESSRGKILEKCGNEPTLVSKHNSKSRTEAAKAYINITNNPLKKAELERYSLLNSMSELLSEIGVLMKAGQQRKPEPRDISENVPCDPANVIELNGALLNGVNLPAQCLRGANLSRANLSEANLREADLNEANLNGANLSSAVLVWASLTRAQLSYANLSKASLRSADLQQASMQGANLRDADLSAANLSGTNLRDANLYAASLSKTNARNANLMMVNLIGSNLIGSDLSGSNLRAADLRHADLRDTNLSKVDLREAILVGAAFTGSDLSRANLRDIYFRNATLRNVNFNGANLEGADLKDADLRDAENLTCDQLKVAKNLAEAKHSMSCD